MKHHNTLILFSFWQLHLAELYMEGTLWVCCFLVDSHVNSKLIDVSWHPSQEEHGCPPWLSPKTLNWLNLGRVRNRLCLQISCSLQKKMMTGIALKSRFCNLLSTMSSCGFRTYCCLICAFNMFKLTSWLKQLIC